MNSSFRKADLVRFFFCAGFVLINKETYLSWIGEDSMHCRLMQLPAKQEKKREFQPFPPVIFRVTGTGEFLRHP